MSRYGLEARAQEMKRKRDSERDMDAVFKFKKKRKVHSPKSKPRKPPRPSLQRESRGHELDDFSSMRHFREPTPNPRDDHLKKIEQFRQQKQQGKQGRRYQRRDNFNRSNRNNSNSNRNNNNEGYRSINIYSTKKSRWEDDNHGGSRYTYGYRNRRRWESPMSYSHQGMREVQPTPVSRYRSVSPEENGDRERRRKEYKDGYSEKVKNKTMFDGDEIDYDWYNQEEGTMDVTEGNPFLGDSKKFHEREIRYKRFHARNQNDSGVVKGKRKSAKHTQFIKDNLRWEENRIKSSGFDQKKRMEIFKGDDLLNEEMDEEKTFVIVHEIVPPFLDGEVTFSMNAKAVVPVADVTSDIAISARKGSEVVKALRLKRDRERATREKFSMVGTRLGNVLKSEKINESSYSLKRDKKYKEIIKNQGKNWGGKTKFAKTEIMEQRRKLPIWNSKNELIQLLRENNVIIVVGETGSGKTTQLTQFFHEGGYTNFGMIGCTQPRRVAAMSVAKRVSEEMGKKLGSTVGYAIRFEDCTSEDTLIKYMTDGVLLRETLRSPDLDHYSIIIMDEAHERSLNTDILFGILRNVVSRRRDLKLIVTSATMDSKKFSNFFGNVPVYNIPGRTFPVKVNFTRTPVIDYVDSAVKQAVSIHTSTDLNEDILIFMTGQEDITSTCEILDQKLNGIENAPKMEILPIYSLLPSELQAKIFKKSEKGVRKCIVATNIAETSLTVDGIYYVIDSGFCKFKVYNPKVGMDVLQRYPESRAGAKQRAGRAGRTGPGICYRLFTKKQFEEEMLEVTVPEIQRTNLGNVILLLKSVGIRDLKDFSFMDPPPDENIKKSLFQLYLLGALDNAGDLTKLGRKMVEFPVDPMLSKMLIVADKEGCTNELLTVVSMLSIPNIFYRPMGQEDESDARREKFFVPESDHLTLLNVYNQWKLKKYDSNWCRTNFLHYKGLRKVREIRAQLLEILQKTGMKLTSCGSDFHIVRKAICSGYFHHVARLKGIGEYVNIMTGLPCSLHPTSALYGIGYTPEYVVYHELAATTTHDGTTKQYMRQASTIDPNWLEELCPLIYSVKRTERTRGIRKKERKIMEKKMQKEREELKKRERENRNIFNDPVKLKIKKPQIITPFSRRKTPRRFGE